MQVRPNFSPDLMAEERVFFWSGRLAGWRSRRVRVELETPVFEEAGQPFAND